MNNADKMLSTFKGRSHFKKKIDFPTGKTPHLRTLPLVNNLILGQMKTHNPTKIFQYFEPWLIFFTHWQFLAMPDNY